MSLLQESKLAMVAGSFYIPKDNPTKPRGEDAHFFCWDSQVIGVADGVGSWAKRGIDAGEYARQLMRNAADFVKNLRPPAAVDPKSVLIHAFQETAELGSSTACILSLDGNRLRAANVGDSRFMVIRRGTTVFLSPVQQHRFNCPYQLAITPGNGPEQAVEMTVQLEYGDIVIVGTDGLFDNVFPADVTEEVMRCSMDMMPPEMVARKLAEKARRISKARHVISPFQVAAYEAGVVKRFGGKYDDITVVVAYVTELHIIFSTLRTILYSITNFFENLCNSFFEF